MAYITKDGKWLAYRDATNEYDDSPKRPIICEINECNILANLYNQHFEVT